ncbi:hypothetical protein [Paraburkholderia pallida]|uniref:Uncharacterized protein n=1 Tax=Paraburkholderia pallida TaxID=2547399 RepID=A0A4P7DAU1_9BURK|nr:hypothetical protein [Paraburkholderia pallida]QBR04350.1 hypothetical protein E1956_45455 [Paraburkholderia pallida]
MPKKFEFNVEQRPAGPNLHSWVAIDIASGTSIDLPRGGNGSMVGQYPEIQEYLANRYQVDVPLIYVTQLDELRIDPDGTSHWTFRRQAAQVTVNDIPRVVFQVQLGRA